MRNEISRRMATKFAAGLVACLTLAVVVGCGGGDGGSSSTPTPPTPPPPPTYSVTASTFNQTLTPGINFGNTMESWNGTITPPSANSQETYWGNPVANQAIFTAYKAAGFKSVRIPVAWNLYADASGNISAAWIARVKQVVDYARNAGLYVIINTHWDGGWLNQPDNAHQAALNARLQKFWTQIATAFADYDDHLLFAGTNEVNFNETWGAPTAENCAVEKSFNQTFVTTVRGTGGNNASRFLIVQSFEASIDNAVSCNATMPTDTATSRLAMEVHFYDPFDFTINNDSNIWQWGQNATDATATETWANEAFVDAQFQKMKVNFVDKGIPVVVGEYGAYMKTDKAGNIRFPGQTAYIRDWTQYVTKSIYSHSLVPMWWDTGALFDRNTGTQKDTNNIGSIINNAK